MIKRADEPGHQHSAPDQASQAAEPIPELRLDTARRADGTFDQMFLAGLRTALHEIGFLQLNGYGATPEQIGELTAAAARLFALPLEQRLRLDNRLSPHFRGYTRLGHEITAGRADAREQIDFAPEQAPVPRGLWDAPYRLLEGPNQWPDDTVPELRPLVEQWAGLLSTIGLELTRAIAVALALPEDHFDQYFTGQPPHQYAEQAPGVSESAHNVLHSRFGDNALKGWLRSHPEVAATHHADLLVQPHATDGSS